MSQIPPLARAYDEVIAFFANGPSREDIATFRLSETATERVRELLRKSSAGTLTSDEDEELAQCSQLDQMGMLIRGRARQQMRTEKGA